jgi:uncharacterized repeat protein (TIGR02543 family)
LGGVSEPPGKDIQVYTVTFHAQGGGALAPQKVIAGSQINKPANPVKAGFIFDNWYDAATAATGAVIAWPLTVNGDMTVYAQWIPERTEVTQYTVTFNTAGGSVFVPQTVIAGAQINRPANPVKAGFVFDNWYDAATAATGAVIAWPLTVNGDMTVYAQWIPERTEVTQYTVTFNTAGGSVFVPQTVIAGAQINRPANPVKAGFIFDNWYDAATAAGGSVIAWPLTVNGDMTVYALWIPERTEVTQYTVTFNTAGGSVFVPQTVIAGAQINRPANPVKAGFIFDNWYDAATAATGSVIAWPLTVNGDMTVYALWIPERTEVTQYTVTFNTAGGSVFVPQTVIAGAQINRPANPVKAGFIFDNWYDAATAAGGSVITWPLTVNGDMTAYALWTAEGTGVSQYTVTFNTGGGNIFVPQTVNAGAQINRPANPVKEGFIFDNWYDATAAVGGSVIAWPLSVNSDMTVYAQWITAEVPLYTVAFNTAGGTSYVPQTVIAGSQINRPANPTKSGFSFDDWYDATSVAGGSVITWPLTVNGNITVYAQWITQFTVTFNTQGGSAVDPVRVNAGRTLERLADPVREGYVFKGWYTAGVGGASVSWPITVNEDRTVFAQWILLGRGSIEVTFSGLPQDETPGFTESVSGDLSWRSGTATFRVPDASFPGASFQWYLDGKALDGATGAAISKPGSYFTLGQHDVTVLITTVDNKVYSKTIRFTVVQ